MRLLKFDTQMYPANRIATTNLNTVVDGKSGVEVTLHGVDGTFTYTGPPASQAYDRLLNFTPTVAPPIPLTLVATLNGKPVNITYATAEGEDLPIVITLDGKAVLVGNIEWVELAARIGNQTGVEIRVATDPQGVTRQYTGALASDAYDVLVALAEEETQAAG